MTPAPVGGVFSKIPPAQQPPTRSLSLFRPLSPVTRFEIGSLFHLFSHRRLEGESHREPGRRGGGGLHRRRGSVVVVKLHTKVRLCGGFLLARETVDPARQSETRGCMQHGRQECRQVSESENFLTKGTEGLSLMGWVNLHTGDSCFQARRACCPFSLFPSHFSVSCLEKKSSASTLMAPSPKPARRGRLLPLICLVVLDSRAKTHIRTTKQWENEFEISYGDLGLGSLKQGHDDGRPSARGCQPTPTR